MARLMWVFILLSASVSLASVSETSMPTPVAEPDLNAVRHFDWLGHNLSQTWYIPDKGSATIGTQVAGYGISKNLYVGTSPWMYTSYNMHNIAFKASSDWMRDNKLGLTAAYFKTGEFYPNKYVMEAASVWVVKAYDVSDDWVAHVNLNYMYFWDETLPFSLRREPFNDQPYQFSLTVLNELRTTKNIGFGTELGVLGVNYTYPHIHVGVSVRYLTGNWLLQAGVSGSNQARAIGRPYTQEQAEAASNPDSDSNYHPEIQVQYHF